MLRDEQLLAAKSELQKRDQIIETMREEIGSRKVLITNLTEEITELQTRVDAGKSSEGVANVMRRVN